MSAKYRTQGRCERCGRTRVIMARRHCSTCYPKLREDEAQAGKALAPVKTLNIQAAMAVKRLHAAPSLPIPTAPAAQWHEVDRIIAIARATNVPVERALEAGPLRDLLLQTVRAIFAAATGAPHELLVAEDAAGLTDGPVEDSDAQAATA